MNSNFFIKPTLVFVVFTLFSIMLLTSCDKDDETPLQSRTFQYQFHNGQAVPSAPYAGVHTSDLSATLLLEELENGNTNITITIQNTIAGETYRIHAHDAADPNTTPNGTPYIESPNADILAKSINGNGGEVSISQEANQSFDNLTSSYGGFFVIHDPLQDVNTMDISTFLIVGGFARDQVTVNYKSINFQYAFNTGQLVSSFAYMGTHNDNLNASITINELADNKSRVTVKIMNTMNGETYHTHAHDVADSSTTPNGTPYNESPNSNVFVAPIDGNGGTSSRAVISSNSYDNLINSYEGFFVIHDPLQNISTADPTTFIILGSFAR